MPLFEKVLSPSDAGRIGRLVLPKACAEVYFDVYLDSVYKRFPCNCGIYDELVYEFQAFLPRILQSEGVPLQFQDIMGNEWTFQFRFWPNNNSRMYVLEGVTPCIQSLQLNAGDTGIRQSTS